MAAGGQGLLVIALIATSLSAAAYVAAWRGKQKVPAWARRAFDVACASVVVASLGLLALLLTHRFDVAYVQSYTSRDLPLPLLISAFWAGQEGSFLLWALMTSVIGVILARRSGDDERFVMPFIALAQLFLLLLLIAKSPFAPTQGVAEEGHGLHPLLQNVWMVAHPPILFLGYALMTVLFAYAMGALVKREYETWVTPVFPWLLAAWTTLFVGIALGGYWAYETLGWGGFWGWDPVENSSLVPWLTVTALLHALVVQRVSGAMQRTSLVLAIVSFLLALYATFLTRSGVLSDISVHSFVAASAGFNLLLLSFPLTLGVIAGVLFVKRAQTIPTPPVYHSLLSRGFAFFASVIVLCAAAALVLIGTSAPLLLRLMGHRMVLTERYYNQVSTPIGMALGLLMALAPLLSWKNTDGAKLCRRLILPLIVTAVAVVVAGVGCGVGWGWLIFIGAAAMAFAVNAERLYQGVRRGHFVSAGGYVAHLGTALFLVGAVGSSVYQRQQVVTVARDEPASALGYQFTYHGQREQSAPGRRVRREVTLHVQEGARTFDTQLTLLPTDEGWVNTPAIRRTLFFDLYLAPKQLEVESVSPAFVLGKGEEKQIGEYEVRFVGFKMLSHGKTPDDFRVGAELEVQNGKGSGIVVPTVDARKRPLDTPTLPGDERVSVQLTDLKADSGQVELRLAGLPASDGTLRERLIMEVTYKPTIAFVWMGVLLVAAGGLLAVCRRAREARRVETAVPAPLASTRPRPSLPHKRNGIRGKGHRARGDH